jgi:rhamnogalacturonan endolyase
MHDPQYRVAIAWQNSAYNQPPHPSFYLGDGMKTPPKPNIQIVVGKESSQVVTGTEENITHKATVFPNPSKHSFQLRMEGKFTYSIITMNGKKIETNTCKNECEIGAKIPSGSYIIQIESAQGNDSLKIVKE